jgi:chemotaxis protein CheD
VIMLEIRVGEGIVARTPEIITSGGLGSCVVVTLYDLRQKLGGMAHIMLPYSTNPPLPPFAKGERGGIISKLTYRFADTAIAFLFRKMINEGAVVNNIIAKIIGGARMFEFDGDDRPRIGEQNVLGVQYVLKKQGIPVIGKDIGGHYGRSVEFYLDSGRVIVKAVGIEDKEI